MTQMNVLFVTTNNGKVQTLRRHLAPYGVEVEQHPLEMPEPRSSDVQEIAEQKARFAHRELRKPLVVLDAGFYVPSLGGFPRAFVNFALETIGIEGILKLAEGKTGEERACEFRECLAYFDGQELRFFVAHIKGRLADAPRGRLQQHHWSRLALIFIPDGCEKTIGEMEYEEYMRWSAIVQHGSFGEQFGQWYVQQAKR